MRTGCRRTCIIITALCFAPCFWDSLQGRQARDIYRRRRMHCNFTSGAIATAKLGKIVKSGRSLNNPSFIIFYRSKYTLPHPTLYPCLRVLFQTKHFLPVLPSFIHSSRDFFLLSAFVFQSSFSSASSSFTLYNYAMYACISQSLSR